MNEMNNEQKKEIKQINKLLQSCLTDKGYGGLSHYQDNKVRGFSIPFKNVGTYSEFLITIEWV